MGETARDFLDRYVERRDPEAFRELVAMHKDMVYASCHRILRNAADAEDAAQRCFLGLARKPEQVRTSVAGWLHRAATGAAINMVRQDRSRRAREAVAMERKARTKSAAWDEVSSAVDEVIDSLPDDLRVPMIRYYLEGHRQEDIAAELGLTHSAISKRLQRGVAEMRKRLEKAGIILSVAALGSLLTTSAAEATPIALTASLGKMALAGATGAGKAAAAGTLVATGGLAMKITASILVAAALAAGGVAVFSASGQKQNPSNAVAAEKNPVAAEEKFVLPPRPDNAAIYYLLAAAMMKRPASVEDLKTLDLIREKLPYKQALRDLPPEVLADLPEVVKFLGASPAQRWGLREGALKPTCHFDLDWSDGPGRLMQHLSVMSSLAHRAVAIGLCEEFKGNPSSVAEIYTDVIRMGAHLGEDPDLISGIVSMLISSIGVGSVEGLLARDPPREAVETVMTGLRRVPRRPFPLDIWLSGRAECSVDWFIAHPEGLRNLRPDGTWPAAERERMAATLAAALADREWALAALTECKNVHIDIARAAKGPYYVSAPRVQGLLEQVERRIEEGRKDPTKANIIFTVFTLQFVPNLDDFHQRVARAESRLDMLRVLTAACMYKAERGTYPPDLEAIAKYLPDGLPKDPFTGKDFIYTLNADLPRIECVPPEGAAEALMPNRVSADPYHSFALDLHRRRREDAAALKAFRKKNAPTP